MPARELILDGEVLALQRDGTPLPFQETMRRFGRRLDVDRLRSELPLTPFFFDCLYIDGRSLTAEPQRERFAALEDVVGALAVPHRIIGDERAATEFFERAIAGGHEGVMAKSLDAPYAAGSRGSAWLKIKKVRTLDLVVLAAEWGSGRRRGWLSNLHLGARDPERKSVRHARQNIQGNDRCVARVADSGAARARSSVAKGTWSSCALSWWSRLRSTICRKARSIPAGLALRFARVKGYRPDKTAEEADTLQTLQEIYRTHDRA